MLLGMVVANPHQILLVDHVQVDHMLPQPKSLGMHRGSAIRRGYGWQSLEVSHLLSKEGAMRSIDEHSFANIPCAQVIHEVLKAKS